MKENGDTLTEPETCGKLKEDFDSSAFPTPPGQEQTVPLSKEAPANNPFDQYYAQLSHQQNMLQDSVRVTAYQRAIINNVADFKVSS